MEPGGQLLLMLSACGDPAVGELGAVVLAADSAFDTGDPAQGLGRGEELGVLLCYVDSKIVVAWAQAPRLVFTYAAVLGSAGRSQV